MKRGEALELENVSFAPRRLLTIGVGDEEEVMEDLGLS